MKEKLKALLPLALSIIACGAMVLIVALLLPKGNKANEKVVGDRTSLIRPYMNIVTTTTAQGTVSAGTSTPSNTGPFTGFIDTTAIATKGLIIRGVPNQTGNLLELQDGSANTLWSINATGNESASGSTPGQIGLSTSGTIFVGTSGFLNATSSIYHGLQIGARTSFLAGGLNIDPSGNIRTSGTLTIAGNVTPLTDATSLLGGNSNRFLNGYFSNGLNSSSSIFSDNNLAIAKTTTNASGTLYIDSGGDIWASGTLRMFGATTLGTLTVTSCVGCSTASGQFSNTSSLYGAYSSSTFTAFQLSSTSTIVVNQSSTNASGTFFITQNGDIAASGTIFTFGTASSTLKGGLTATVLSLTSTSVSSTLANGLILNAGCITQNNGASTSSCLTAWDATSTGLITGTGDITFAHSLGRVPNILKLTCTEQRSNTAAQANWSDGMALSPLKQMTVYHAYNGTNETSNVTNDILRIPQTNGTDSEKGIVTSMTASSTIVKVTTWTSNFLCTELVQ